MARILLVEDNEMNRDLITRRLKRQGYEIEVAVDGAEAVDKATAGLPDLIVMDMGLPVLDGYEATRLIKAAKETRHIPIIGLSAHAMSGDADKARTAGCDDYDTKPVEWARLMPKIEALLEKAREARENATGEMPTTMLSQASSLEGGRVRRILIVDDNALNRETLRQRLGELGYSAATAETGTEALETLERETFDALLLDVRLPDATGADFLKRLRAADRWKELPVLMITPVDQADHAIACFELGASDFVPQPFQREVLAQRLGALLDRHRLYAKEAYLDGDARHSEHLLRILLPDEVVAELQETHKVLPRRYPDVALLTVAVPELHEVCDSRDPLDALTRLQELLIAFEETASHSHVQQVRSAGDAVLFAGGLFNSDRSEPVLDCVRCALEMKRVAAEKRPEWSVRYGLHVGAVVAGVAGRRRYQFDLWGTAVQHAFRVLRHGPAGEVTVTDTAWQRVASSCSGILLDPVALPDGDSLALYRVDRLTV